MRRGMLLPLLQVLAVALGQAVYLWNAATGSIEHLLTLSAMDDFVTRYSCIRVGGGLLGVGFGSRM